MPVAYFASSHSLQTPTSASRSLGLPEVDAQRAYDKYRVRIQSPIPACPDAPIASFPQDNAILDELMEGTPDLIPAIKGYVAALGQGSES